MKTTKSIEQQHSASVECPVCGCAHGRVIRTYSSKEVAQRFIRREVDGVRHAELCSHIERLWRGERCDLLVCIACGLGFAWPFVAGDDLFYQLSSERTNYPQKKWEYSRTVSALTEKRIADRGCGRLLDIGAGNGAFLRAIARAGWPKDRLEALEYSQYGFEVMTSQGFKCHRMGLINFFPAAPIDVACMFQVLEHMDTPVRVLQHIAAISARDADLYIAVPNGAWQNANEVEGIGDDFPPNHITRWGKENFVEVASRSGWTVCDIEMETPRPFTAARYAATERFMRNSETSGSRANHVLRLAKRMPGRKLERAVKAVGSLLEPECWSVARRRALRHTLPPNIWVHLTRDPAASAAPATQR